MLYHHKEAKKNSLEVGTQQLLNGDKTHHRSDTPELVLQPLRQVSGNLGNITIIMRCREEVPAHYNFFSRSDIDTWHLMAGINQNICAFSWGIHFTFTQSSRSALPSLISLCRYCKADYVNVSGSEIGQNVWELTATPASVDSDVMNPSTTLADNCASIKARAVRFVARRNSVKYVAK